MALRSFALVLCLAPLAVATGAKADVTQGRALYIKVGCYQCHGTEGQGGVAGPRLAPAPMAWEAFAQYVHNTTDAMPPYRESVLPGTELKLIHDFLLSIPPPPNVDDIPLLRALKKRPAP
ncbi:MAG: cytochrome c [Rhodospirillaceae bacterium]|nr:cytochrome c [Rhodospirillaceae bacterium]